LLVVVGGGEVELDLSVEEAKEAEAEGEELEDADDGDEADEELELPGGSPPLEALFS